ncbi:TPA: hypothetical protein ACT5CK_000932 [Flavobacterium psychrophilum]|uniref:hypothetical protein n=1 Tax=Flavobacterium psychrophilum TaxID=96345 RepID=UPI00073E68EA|nr:hypothetical protein [Flavobacterium psychrophilum]SNB96919.1 conserved hypothetical protein [Flavobacterium psychrophilum]GAQ49279.1 hypothetical protein FPK15_contig00033-0003 [Flavobacterium psychrophilum]GAW89901.1 hypothetical protein FPS14_contig00033-0032 [Flavobacterium psychrophilum]GEJ32964.1 hypothetical protein FPN181_contig00015-0039 [Flavobacterium psychrophilum]GEJ36036.1 hypothetical protein FPN182_contig00006-0039 [Flavobacterium psychrophilum]
MIKEYLQKFDLDVRKSGDARFMDQKCTPDVVSTIADCVINFVGNEKNKQFTVSDIWESQYFIKNVKAIFNKPLATNPTTKSEYDKFIQQPLRMLAYANILNIVKIGNKNHYSIANYEILEYISLKDRNAYLFLCDYLEKVLTDSGIFKYFEEYKSLYENGKLENIGFDELKSKFQKFIIGNTKINGVIEVNRIYPKILNVFATQNNLPGTIGGFMSKHEFYYTDLMYNRKNWRDVKKSKNISRQESEIEYDALISETENPYNNYLIQKAMTAIRKLYTESEIKDQWGNGDATQIHHIFPKHKFPQLAHYLENLIKLTATQHYTKAHPNNKTKDTSTDYQLVCLLAKSDSIEKSLKKNEMYYRKESFIYCINTGLTKELKFDLTFRQIKSELATIYNDL